jgi:hypothetical protein
MDNRGNTRLLGVIAYHITGVACFSAKKVRALEHKVTQAFNNPCCVAYVANPFVFGDPMLRPVRSQLADTTRHRHAFAFPVAESATCASVHAARCRRPFGDAVGFIEGEWRFAEGTYPHKAV